MRKIKRNKIILGIGSLLLAFSINNNMIKAEEVDLYTNQNNPGIKLEEEGGKDKKTKKNKEETSFFKDRERGWFWYEDPEVEKKKKEEKKTQTQTASIPKLEKPKIDWEKVWDLPPEEFKRLLDQVRDYALYKTTPENVYNYLRLQKVAIKRSEKFMNVAAYVAMTHPDVMFNSIPETKLEAEQTRIARLNYRRQKLREVSRGYGVVFFYKPNCKYCQMEIPVLDALAQEYGFEVRGINISQNPNLAYKFNIRVTPSLILVSKRNPKKYMLISEGFINLANLLILIPRATDILEGRLTPDNFLNWKEENIMMEQISGKSR